MDVMSAAFNLVHNYPGGAVALAPMLGKNPATLSHEVSPHYPTAKFGLEDAVKASVWTGDRSIASAFASQVGCMLVPLPQVAGDLNGFEALSKMAKEFGELVGEVGDTVSDGKVTPNELKRVQAEAAQLVAAVEATVQHVAGLVARQRERAHVEAAA